MNAFAHFAAQHAALMDRTRSNAAARIDARMGSRADTPTETKALNYVKTVTACDVKQIARAIEVDAELLYPVMQRLKRNGQIVSAGRRGNGNLWAAA